jgi:hypothetical protein
VAEAAEAVTAAAEAAEAVTAAAEAAAANPVPLVVSTSASSVRVGCRMRAVLHGSDEPTGSTPSSSADRDPAASHGALSDRIWARNRVDVHVMASQGAGFASGFLSCASADGSGQKISAFTHRMVIHQVEFKDTPPSRRSNYLPAAGDR